MQVTASINKYYKSLVLVTQAFAGVTADAPGVWVMQLRRVLGR